jgi:hypothetical protein
MPVQTQMQVRRGTASSWTSTNPTLAAGELGFETDTGKFKIGTGSSTWTGLAYATGLNAITYLYNATASQTTFSGVDANGLTLAYTVGTEQVFLNGVLQVRGSDYTATDGTSIVLTSGALVGDVLNIIAYGATTITDTYTQAQADAKFVQQTNNFFAGKNRIINGDFGVWQRGTSFSNPTQLTYQADRWTLAYYDAQPTTYTISQQTFTPGTAPVLGYEGTFFGRSTITTVGSTTIFRPFDQKIEDVRTFAGQTVTFSLWAKADSARSFTMNFQQNFGTGGSGAVGGGGQAQTLSTSWQRFTWTFAIPSISGKTIGTGSNLEIIIQQAASSGSVLDVWGIQLEAGSIATPFETATGTIAGELAACQRYYVRFTNGGVYQQIGQGTASSTGGIGSSVPLPVQMRVTPGSIDVSNLAFSDDVNAPITGSIAIITSQSSPTKAWVAGSSLSVPATQFRLYNLITNNNAAGFLGVNAEL